MKVFDDIALKEIATLLRRGWVGVVRTDTLYGLVARADNQRAVERIFSIKQRSPDKPVLVLIADQKDLFDEYDITSFEASLWPGKNTIILPSPTAPEWVTRGTGTVAYRLPDNDALRRLISQSGPLIAPSANPEGLPPAENIQEAMNYFGELVDFYVDGGRVADNTPSRLLRPLPDGTMERLR